MKRPRLNRNSRCHGLYRPTLHRILSGRNCIGWPWILWR